MQEEQNYNGQCQCLKLLMVVNNLCKYFIDSLFYLVFLLTQSHTPIYCTAVRSWTSMNGVLTEWSKRSDMTETHPIVTMNSIGSMFLKHSQHENLIEVCIWTEKF